MDDIKKELSLTDFQKFVLSQIIPIIEAGDEFYLYDLIREVITHKDISSFPDHLIMETHEAITRHLMINEVIVEKIEKRVYSLTAKGMQNKTKETKKEFNESASHK